jgi:hypothetical protein
LRAPHLNPDGISHPDAVRALHEAGYSDAQIAEMIETVGTDKFGSVLWQWRSLDPTDESAHDPWTE